MGSLDALASKFNDAKPLGQNRPFDAFGNYLQEIQQVRHAGSFKHGGEYCAIEKRVVKVLQGPDQGLQGNPVGQEIVDLINNYGNQAKVFGSKTRGFIAAVLGEPFENVTFDSYLAACAESQPLAGMLVEINNSPKTVEVKKGAKAGQQEQRPAKQYVRGYTPLAIPSVLTPEEVDKNYIGGSARLLRLQQAQKKTLLDAGMPLADLVKMFPIAGKI